MDPLITLTVAATSFLVTHCMSATNLRPMLVSKVGEKGYSAIYSLLAFATLAWTIAAYRAAPDGHVIWPAGPGIRHIPLLLMPIAFIFVVLGASSGKDTPTSMVHSMGGKPVPRGDHVRGILRITRHPVNWGIMLWSSAHILANGDLASIIFFGAMFLTSAIGVVLIDRRKASTLGSDWEHFAAATSNIPFAAIIGGRNSLKLRELGLLKIVVACLAFGAMLMLHTRFFGVRPM